MGTNIIPTFATCTFTCLLAIHGGSPRHESSVPSLSQTLHTKSLNSSTRRTQAINPEIFRPQNPSGPKTEARLNPIPSI